MSKIYIPEDYSSRLSLLETQNAIDLVRNYFKKNLSESLNLKRVSAPLILKKNSGLNDDLNGIERPVEFDIKSIINSQAQIVHSLAKWKRKALLDYGFNIGEGLYADMNAIRRDEDIDNIHSVYVDQWDWEKNYKYLR